jgi:hemoglobin
MLMGAPEHELRNRAPIAPLFAQSGQVRVDKVSRRAWACPAEATARAFGARLPFFLKVNAMFVVLPGRVAPSLATLVLVASLNACAVTPAQQPTLYERLGGAQRVDALVSRLIDRAAGDPRTQRSFDGIKLKALKESLAQQICSISGGGCRYEGETMARSHAELKIVASEFDAMVGMLREELDGSGTDPGAKNELLRLLAPMKRDIVGGKPAAAKGS